MLKYQQDIHNYIQSYTDDIINTLRELVKTPAVCC